MPASGVVEASDALPARAREAEERSVRWTMWPCLLSARAVEY
jgi:hypothetical protein